MSVALRITHHVEGAPDRVFRALTDQREAHLWIPGLVRFDPVSEDDFPMHLGSRFRETRMIFRKEGTEEFEVIGFEPPARLGFRVDGSKGSSRHGEYLFDYVLAPERDGTLITLDAEIRGLNAVGRLVARLMAGSYRKAIVRDLESLGAYLRRERRGSSLQARVS